MIMNRAMIVKVQRSPYTTAEPKVLIYNKPKSFEIELPAAACIDLLALMDDEIPKAFFKVSLIDGVLHVHERVPEQHW